MHRTNAEGLAGLANRRSPGASPLLPPEQKSELAALVEAGPDPQRRRSCALAAHRFSGADQGAVRRVRTPVPNAQQNRSCREKRRSTRGYAIIRDGTVSFNCVDYQCIGDLISTDSAVLGCFSFVQFQKLSGSAQADKLEGGTGSNALSGAMGNDVLSGLTGDDLLNGADGADTLTGGAGEDALLGGTGVDQLTGGLGGDVLRGQADGDRLTGGTGADRITDFACGSDLIDFAVTLMPGDISLVTVGRVVRPTVGTTSVLVDKVTIAQMQDPANFPF